MEQQTWNQQLLTIPVNSEVLLQCSHWVTRHDFEIIGLDSATSSPSYPKSRLTIRIISPRQVSYCTLSITNSSYRPTDKPTINRHSGFRLQASLHHLFTFWTAYFDKTYFSLSTPGFQCFHWSTSYSLWPVIASKAWILLYAWLAY